MTAKDIMTACRHAAQEMASIQRQIDMIHIPGEPSGYKGVIITDMPRGTNDPKAAALQSVTKYELLLAEAKQRNANILAEFELMLMTVDDCLARTILREYYGLGKSDYVIADMLHYVRPTITRKRNIAENYLDSTYKARNITPCYTSSML